MEDSLIKLKFKDGIEVKLTKKAAKLSKILKKANNNPNETSFL